MEMTQPTMIQEPSEVVQFQYNSDWPTLEVAAPPAEFPPANPSPCARITTRVYDPATNQVKTVQNVLVKTLIPTRISNMDQDSSSSSSSSDDDDDDDNLNEFDDDDVMMQDDTSPIPSTPTDSQERAYWMQRTVREAIYGRVLYAIVLKRRVPSRNDIEAEWQVTSEKCAVKEMSWNHIRQDRDRLAEDPIKEVSAMQYLSSWYQQQNTTTTTTTMHQEENSSLFGPILETNIMMPLDLISDDRHLYSIMPYCDGGELFDRLDLNEKFSEVEARFWMHQVLNGLEHLQKSGICHRDMSLENLLVHQNGALIIDMGMCLRIPYQQNTTATSTATVQVVSESLNSMNLDTFVNGNANTQQQPQQDATLASFNGKTSPRLLMTPQGTCGKWIYMSPEIYKNQEPFDGFAVDMWAAGVILFLMLTGFPPWERACMTDDRFKYMTAGYLVQMLTEWQVGLSSDAMDLLQRMLFLDPKDRLSLDQVKAHPWMMVRDGVGAGVDPSSIIR